MIKLYDYQNEIVEKTRAELKKGKRSILIQSPTGSGKTVIFSHLISEMEKKGKRALIITDRTELLFETGGTLEEFGLQPYYIMAGQMIEPPNTHQVYVSMSQTLRRRIDKWPNFFNWFDGGVFLDECFIAGTLIDNKPIEKIKIGDYVNSFNHKTRVIEKKKVLNTFKNKIKSDLIKVNLSCVSFVCTQKHPIFVIGKGYINAKDLCYDDRIIMYDLPKSHEKRRFQAKQLVRQKKEIFKEWVFFLFGKMQSRIFCKNAFRANEKKQSDEKRRVQKKNVRNFKKNWSQTSNPRRKRERNDSSSTNVNKISNNDNCSRLVPRIGCININKRVQWVEIATSLQNRYRLRIRKNCNRNRWGITLFNNRKKKRPEKNRLFKVDRVQSIEIQKRGSYEGRKKSEKYNYVYNIEVADNNNYFANNALVHNCHKQEFNPYFEQCAFPKRTYIFGFSATPIRTGKQRQLHEDYEVMIEGLQVPELIKRGNLVPDQYYSTSAPDLDHAKYNSKGDYSESWMFDKFNKTEIYDGVVENWSKICPNTNTLVFCVNIQHTIEVCRKFNEHGIPAKFVVSDVAKPVFKPNMTEAQKVKFDQKQKEYDNFIDAYQKYSGNRKSIIQQWKDNKFKVLCNAGILTTGFNRKDIETIVLNRATTSLALYLQMIGRGSRIYPNKDHFNILDFGGNGERLGYYNQERKWSLTHDQKKGEGATPVKECGGDNNNRDDKDKVPDINGRFGCGSFVFVSAEICPYCGYVFKKEKPKKFAELIKIDYLDTHFPEKNTQIDEFKTLERTAEQRGYKAGWVVPQIIAKSGEDGLKEYAKYRRQSEPDKFGNGWVWQTKKRFKNLIDNYNKKNQE